MLNCTYNLTYVRGTKDWYESAYKPIRVLHFNPACDYTTLKPLMSPELLEILERYKTV